MCDFIYDIVKNSDYTILDIGCGLGYLTFGLVEKLRNSNNHYHIIAVDGEK